MPFTRRLVAHSENEDNTWLKVDHSSRYIQNFSEEWSFLFNVNSTLSKGTQVLKLAAQLDTTTLDKIRLIGYLYNNVNGTVDNAASITFDIYKVVDSTFPKWDDQFIISQAGIVQSNNYFFKDIDISTLTGTSLDGDTTLMIEATATRLGVTYRDRIYVNHLGVYSSIIKLRQDVEFLDITKLDE